MKIFTIFPFFLLCKTDIQPQRKPCEEHVPFRLIDQSCDSFNEICVKKEDEQCNQLLNACKQCPPSNITMAILRDVWNISKFLVQSNFTQQIIDENIRKIFERFDSTQKSMTNKSNESSPTFSNAYCTILLVIIIIILVVHILETRFKFCTKFFSRCGKSDIFQYSLLESRKRTYLIDIIKQLKKLESKINQSLDIKFATIQFQFDGIEQQPIELYVHNNHNIVQVKQQIFAKLPLAKHDDYKIMKLKYNGIILNDDNQYLLEIIDKSNTIVNCFIDSSMKASDIVVVNLLGKMRLPDIIQINKNQTGDQLKELIGKIINSKDFLLFKQSNESIKTEELKDNLNNLMDGDWIRIVTKEFGKLIIRSIFDDEDSITIEYVNVDLVSSLLTSISNKYNWHLNSFVLFYNNKCLESEKYIFEYQISSESAVKYCCFMKWAGIKMDDTFLTIGNFSELRFGTFINTNRKILVKKYEVKSSKTWKDEEFMLKELITFQITKSHSRFIQLLGVYIEDTTLYVVMENMDGGTLKTFLQKNYDKININKIYRWSAQILEGLKFLHENKVIHRDLNPSSILVDGNDDLKLSSFNLSKYLDISKPASIMGKRDKREDFPVRYMAPEILNSEIYGEACDVWSFGAVLIRVVTNERPYSNSTKTEALSQISNQKMIEYKLPDKYSEFKSIIDSCLKYEPIKRESVNKLMTNENIKKYMK